MNCFGILASLDPVKEIAAHRLFTIVIAGKEIVFSNHMLMIFIAAVFLGTVIPLSLIKNPLVRTGFGNFIEGICVYLREEVVRPFLKEKTDNYICLLWTMFFFIITLNLLGLVPFEKFFSLILVIFGGEEIHIGGAATANIWVTGALAVVSFLVIHISGIRAHGLLGHLKNLAPPVPWPLMPFVYLVELMSSVIKPFALAVRLFANVFAGHVLISVVLSFILIFKSFAIAGPSLTFAVLMSFLELFVACLQAYIFVFLTTIFISFSIAEEH